MKIETDMYDVQNPRQATGFESRTWLGGFVKAPFRPTYKFDTVSLRLIIYDFQIIHNDIRVGNTR